MQFNFNFEAFEKSGKDKQEAINYLKNLNSSIDFDKLESEAKGDNELIYNALKIGNFSFSKPSVEEQRQKFLKNKENEALKAEFHASTSWLDENQKENYNFYDFKKAKEFANSKAGKIEADLKASEKELERKKALYKKQYENADLLDLVEDSILQNTGLNYALDVGNKLFKGSALENKDYISSAERANIEKSFLQSARQKVENGAKFEDLEALEKRALSLNNNEADREKAFLKEKEKQRLIQKGSGYSKAEIEFMEEDLGFFHTLFNDDKETKAEFKDKYFSEGVIKSEVQRAVNTLKQFDESELLKNIFFADKKESEQLKQKYLSEAYKIAELSGFDDVGLSKENELYFIKKDEQGNEQKYKVNTGFLDNFTDTLLNAKFEIAAGITGALAGAKKGKTPMAKALNSIAGGAAGSLAGALTDAKLADMALNRESDFKRNLDYAIQAGLLSVAGDGVILAVPTLYKKGVKPLAKGAKNFLENKSVLGFAKTIPTQNISAAESIINEVFTPEMKAELKEAQEKFGGGVKGEDLANSIFSKLEKEFGKKYGKDDEKTQKIAKLAEIFNANSLKTRQQEMLDLVRSDKDGSTLAYLLEVAKDDVKVQQNLKNMLNIASFNVEKNLKNLNIKESDIKSIMDEFESGNKAAFKEVESQISKLYDDNFKVVLDKGAYESVKEEFLKNGVNLDEATPFLKDIENNVFSKEGVTFTQLNNFRKNLNYYIFNKDKSPNFINSVKKVSENILKSEIDKGIDNIFNEIPSAYESIKELYSTSLKDYAAMKELNESVKKLGLQDKEKTTDEVVKNLIKFAKGQGEADIGNLDRLKNYLGEENNAFLEMQILNRLFKESIVENERAKVRVIDSESFLNKVKELVGEREVYDKNELLKDFGENFAGYKGKDAINKLLEEKRGQVSGAFYKEGLGDIDLVWGDKNYGLEHILNKHGGEFENLAEQLDEIITKGEVVKRRGRKNAYNIEHNGFKVGINQGFNQKGENKWIVTAFNDSIEVGEKTAKTAPANDFTKETHLSLNSKESITQPFFKSKEAREFLENLEGAKIPKELSIENFLKQLESVENKENFIEHLSKKEDAQSRLAYLNLVKPTLEKPDLILQNGKRQDFIKKFNDGKDFFTLLITEENGKRLITFIPKTREQFIKNKIQNASLIQSFTSRASNHAFGLAEQSITQPFFKSKEAREFLELIEGFHTLYKNDASIAKAFTQGTASHLSTSIATTAEGAIKQKVVKGGFDPIFRLLPEGILFGMFSKQIQGGALRYHLKKALSRSLNYDDFKIKLEKQLSKSKFNNATLRLIDSFMQNLEDFNKAKEAKLAQKEAKRKAELEAQEAEAKRIKAEQNAIYETQAQQNLKDILESDEPLEDFGTNYGEFYHNGKGAVEKLLKEQSGQVQGAFYREELGDIDLVWGDESFGLKHIIDKHGGEFKDLASELSEIVNKGEVLRDGDRATLKYIKENGEIYKIGLKGNWKGEETKNKWIITAYKDEREMAKTIDSSNFTKGETLPLNSSTIIPQKILSADEALRILQSVEAKKVPKELDIEGFLKELESVENKENFITHLSKKEDAKSRLAYLNLVKPTLEEADLILKTKNKFDEPTKEFIKAFQDENKRFFYIVITEQDNEKKLLTAFKTNKLRELKNRIEKARDFGEISSAHRFIKSPTAENILTQKSLNLTENIYLKDNDTPLKVEYVVVKKEDLKPSFTLSKTQFRSEKQEALIKNITENFNADLIVNKRGDLKNGNPIVTQKGEVISGNHRIQALKALKGENLAKYQNAVKEAFNVDLNDDEILVRLVDKDISEADIKRYAAASNEGLENNLGEQGVSLFAKYKDKIMALKEQKEPFIAEDVYNLKELVNRALGEKSITKQEDTNKALFSSLVKGSNNNNILNALNELEKESYENISKISNMFFDNAGAFFNLINDLELPKMQNLQNYLNDALVSTAKAENSRADDFLSLNNDIFEFVNAADKKALLTLEPNRVRNLKSKVMGAGFARFARLENPSQNLFEFLNSLKNTLFEKGQPSLFDANGTPLKERDEYDFLEELILQGQDTSAKFDLVKNLRELREWENEAEISTQSVTSADNQVTIAETNNFNKNSLEPRKNTLPKYDEALEVEVIDEPHLLGKENAEEKQKFLTFHTKKLLEYKGDLNTPLNAESELKTRDILDYIKKADLSPKEAVFLIHNAKDEAQILKRQILEAAQKWLETFGLKSLNDEVSVEIPQVVKEKLGKELILNQKDFEKIVEKGREKYIPQIKETFKEPEAVFIDENDDLIFAKSFNDKLFFVNVNRDYGEAFKALSLAPKKNNNLLNKLDKAKEILKLDSKLRDSTAQQAFTGVLSAPNKSNAEIIAQKDAQEQWLETFGLKSMDETYTPNFSEEVKEALEPVLKGEEIRLTRGSFEKLLKRDREEFLPFIKETLERADLIVKDKEGAVIFVKDIGKKSYFVSVAKNANNEWIISTNSLKTLNTLKNRVDDNGEVLFLSKEASNILAEAFTKRAFSNELAGESIAQQSKPQALKTTTRETEKFMQLAQDLQNKSLSKNDKIQIIDSLVSALSSLEYKMPEFIEEIMKKANKAIMLSASAVDRAKYKGFNVSDKYAMLEAFRVIKLLDAYDDAEKLIEDIKKGKGIDFNNKIFRKMQNTEKALILSQTQASLGVRNDFEKVLKNHEQDVNLLIDKALKLLGDKKTQNAEAGGESVAGLERDLTKLKEAKGSESKTKLDKARVNLSKIDEGGLSNEQKELLKLFKGEIKSVKIQAKDLKDIYTLKQGSRKEGAKKILIKHYGEEKTGGLSDEELLGIKEVIKKGEINLNSLEIKGDILRYGYDYEKDGVKLRVVVDEFKEGKKIFDYYSDRNFNHYEQGGYKPDLPTPSEIIPQQTQKILFDTPTLESNLNNTLESYSAHDGVATKLKRSIIEKERELKDLVAEKEKVEQWAQTIKEQSNSRALTKIAKELEKIGFDTFSKHPLLDYEALEVKKVNPRLDGKQFFYESTIINFKDLKKFIKSREDFIKFKNNLDTLYLADFPYGQARYVNKIKDFDDIKQARFYQIFNENNYDNIIKELIDKEESKVKNIDNDKIISLQKELEQLKEQLEKTNQSLAQSERELEQIPFLQKLLNSKPLFDKFLFLRLFNTMSEKELKKHAKKAFGDDDIYDVSRGYIEKALNITPLKEFGTNYAEFYRDGKGAVKKLIREAEAFKQSGEKGEFKGQVSGAFYREELGDIDLVWGDESFGLKHIIDKHGGEFENLARELSEAVENGVLKKQNEVRSRIEYGNFVIGLSGEFKGEKRAFIITAFNRKGESSTLSPKQDFTDKSDDVLSNPESIIPQKNDALSEVVDNYEHFYQRYGERIDGSLYLDDFKALSKDEQREFSHILYTFRNYLNQYDKSFENATDSIKKAYELDILGQEEANNILKKAKPQRNITKYIENALGVIKSIKASKEYGGDYFEKLQELKDIENKFYKYITGLEKTKKQIENIQFQIQKANLEKLNTLNDGVKEAELERKALKTFEISQSEAEILGEHFKGKKPLLRELRENEIKHALKSHGDEKSEKARGNIAITRADIEENYPSITQEYDEKFFTDKGVIYVKQVNGHHIAIEEALLGQDKLIFKSLWKTKGNYNKEVLTRNAKTSLYPQNADEAVRTKSISSPKLEQGNPPQSHLSTSESIAENNDTIQETQQKGEIKNERKETTQENATDQLKADKRDDSEDERLFNNKTKRKRENQEGAERNGVEYSHRYGQHAQEVFSQNGNATPERGIQRELFGTESLRTHNSESKQSSSVPAIHLRDNHTGYNDDERHQSLNPIRRKQKLYNTSNIESDRFGSGDGALSRNDALHKRVLNPKESEVLERKGIKTSLSKVKETKAKENPQNYTFKDEANENKILEDNYKALEELDYLIKRAKLDKDFTKDMYKEYTKHLVNFRGFGKAANALLKLEKAEKEKWENLLKTLSEQLGAKITLNDLIQRSADAYYTPEIVIKKMVDLVKSFANNAGVNLEDITKLEPSAGIGRFFNYLPQERLFGVEKDTLSAKIASFLYPYAKIDNNGYEKSFFKLDNEFALVIGNPPYANFKIGDESFRESIHNYFMKKNIDVLKENGVSLQIVTHSFLDAKSAYTRNIIAKDAEFLGAIRLPNNIFKDASVTTDIIAFRKKTKGEKLSNEGENLDWLEAVELEKGVFANKYFLENPQNVLGKMEVVKGQFGNTISVKDTGLNLENLVLAQYFKHEKALKVDEVYSQNLYNAVTSLKNKQKGVSFFESARSGELHFDKDSNAWMILDDKHNKHDFNVYERIKEVKPDWKESTIETRLERLKEIMPKIVKTREALFRLKEAEMEAGVSDEKLDILRRSLNKAYDDMQEGGSFRNVFNKISQKWELYEILDDTSFELFALEKKALVKENASGKKVVKGSVKSDIFFKRLTKPYTPPTSANNILEALQISKAENGNVNLERMAQLLDKELKEVENELLNEKILYKNHKGENVEKDEFLSGNIRQKIASFYDENGNLKLSEDEGIKNLQLSALEDLKKIIPEDVEVPHLFIPLGANWLDKSILEEFLSKDLDLGDVKLRFSKNKTWEISGIKNKIEITTGEQYANDTGIKAIDATNFLDKMMNNESLEVKTSKKLSDGKTKFYKDPIASQKLGDLKESLEKSLKKFIMENEAYAEHTKRVYNEIFNSEVQRKYDGSHIQLVGANEDIKLREHQNNAVYRFLQKLNTLLAHDVGTGKTFTMIASAMLSKHLNLAKKSLIVTPNNVSVQMAREARQLYPNARIKVVQGVSTADKNRLLAQVKQNDYDIVIASYEAFKNMNASPKLYQEYQEKELRALEAIIDDLQNSNGENGRLIKSLAKRLEKEKDKLEKYISEIKSSKQNVFFEDLGIDNLIFDEAHYLKNLPIFTRQVNVKGIGKANSQRALDAYIKIKYHQSLDKKVMFATGTPITNFVSDIFVMQKYLDEEGLNEKGVGEFDGWSGMFAKPQTQFELKPNGNYEATTRLRKFTNLPELKKMYYSFTDLVTKEDMKNTLLKSGQKPNEPEPEYINVVLKPSERQKAYLEEIKNRSESLKGKKIEKGGDNHLKILSDANKASLDMRLIDKSLPREEGGKVTQSAERIFENYKKYDEDKATQMVFLDSSTPKRALTPAKRRKYEEQLRKIEEKLELYDEGDIDLSAEALEKLENEKDIIKESLEMARDGFSVYEDLKQALIEKGIKEHEIAFVHDFNRQSGAFSADDLHAKMESGEIRVLIGSTAKMGAGSNFQKRLCAIHHLDLDWTPANMEQREGRIIRQGNALFEKYGDAFKAKIYYYVTEQTSDTVMLQTLNQKRKIIKQITNPLEKQRYLEDTSEDDFMARLQAATSPYAEQELRFLGIDKDIALLKSEVEDNDYIIKSAEREIKKQEAIKAEQEMQKALLPELLKNSKNNFTFKSEGSKTQIKFNEKAKKGEKSPIEMMNTLIFTNLSKFNASMEKITPLGEYRGNKLYGVKAGREIVIKIGNDVQNSIPLFGLSEFEIKLSLNANSRLKNAYEKLENEKYLLGLDEKINEAQIYKEKALKKLENEKSRDLNGVYQQLNELQLEKAELAVFLGRAEGKERQIISEFYDVPDIKENENDKYTMLERFLMNKYNKN